MTPFIKSVHSPTASRVHLTPAPRILTVVMIVIVPFVNTLSKPQNTAQELGEAVAAIRERTRLEPRVALILGSGWGRWRTR